MRSLSNSRTTDSPAAAKSAEFLSHLAPQPAACALLAIFSVCCFAVLGQSPPALPPDSTPEAVRDLVRSAAEALQNKDADGFLGYFDKGMPGYEMLHFYAEGLAARNDVRSSVEIVPGTDHGDDKKRTLALDWSVNIDSERLRRAVVKVTVEKQGKKWKFTALDPVDFFKPPE